MTTRPLTDAGSRGLWLGLLLGLPVMAFGVGGALVDADRTHPSELARWVVGLAVLHDVAVVPITLAIASILRGRTGGAWPVLRWALALSAILTAFALPFILGYGRDPTIPSLLQRNYAQGLVVLLVGVWSVAGVALLVTRPGARGSRRASR